MMRRSERGQSAVEFALVIPVMLLFLFGIFQIGITYFNNESISTAARDGARAGAIRTGMTEPEIVAAAKAAVIDNASGTNTSKLVIDVTCSGSCAQGDTVFVTVRYPWDIGVMGFAMSGTLQAKSQLPME
jgi:Flp pilus assembly protein TadG